MFIVSAITVYNHKCDRDLLIVDKGYVKNRLVVKYLFSAI
jgi:hypothetical protein